ADGTAAFIVRQVELPSGGDLYHLTAGGNTSWHGFAEAIVKLGAQAGLCPEVPVDPITTAEYPLPARRPVNSLLDHHKLETALDVALPSWESGLKSALSTLSQRR